MSKEKKINFDILLYIFIPLILFAIVDMPFVFYNNDDLYMKQIVSGELTGTPEAHLLHIGYLTGLFLSTLYKLFPPVPWYGILLFSYGYLSIILSIYMCMKHILKKTYRAPGTILVIFIALSFTAIHLINIQFTTITAIVCAASIIFFYLSEETENIKDFLINNIPSFILFFLSLELRNTACIMFLPTFLLLIIIKWARNHKLFKSLLAYFIILLSILTLSVVSEKIAYSSDQWSTFKTYNTSRSNIVDYSAFPDYQEYAEEYESLDITYQSYISVTNYQLLLDENINVHFMQRMEDLLPDSDFILREICSSFIERHTVSYADRPLNLIVYALYFFTILLIILSKNKQNIWDVLALFCGRNIIWFYILYIGRPVTRVTQGIYVVELLMLLAILLKNQPWKDFVLKKSLRNIFCIFSIACLLFISIKEGIPNTCVAIEQNKNYLLHSDAYQEAREYFYENKDNLYLLDTMSFSYFYENIFSRTPASCNNFILLGGWTANSPWADSIIEQFGYSSYEEAVLKSDNVFFVFMNSEQTDYNYLIDYFNEKYPNSSLIVTDTLQCSNGLEFLILQAQFE